MAASRTSSEVGRPGRAAMTYAVTAIRHGSRADARRAVGATLRALGLRRAHEAGEPAGPAPDWLAISP